MAKMTHIRNLQKGAWELLDLYVYRTSFQHGKEIAVMAR
jgi:hypothetical protein